MNETTPITDTKEFVKHVIHSRKTFQLALSKTQFKRLLDDKLDVSMLMQRKYMKSKLYDKNDRLIEYDYILFTEGIGLICPYIIATYRGFSILQEKPKRYWFSHNITFESKNATYTIHVNDIVCKGNLL